MNTKVRPILPLILTSAFLLLMAGCGGEDSSSKEPSEAAIARAIQALDKAAKRGVIHSNNAARRKSRLMKKFNSLLPEG